MNGWVPDPTVTTDGRTIFPARVVAAFLTNVADLNVSEATIRQWASRGHIKRRGTGANGCGLYDPREVLNHARHADRRSLRAA